MKRIRNIVFDLGNVLVRFDPELFIERLSLSDKADEIILLNEVFRCKEWAMADLGTLNDEQLYESICARIPNHLHAYARALIFDWFKPLIYVDGMMDLCKKLKKNGYSLYLLSNASTLQNEYWDKMPCYPYFSGKITSAEELMVKPDERIYQLLCKRYNLAAEECVMIDDSVQNCAGARSCGMNAILFHGDCTILKNELRALGIQLDSDI